MSDLAVGRLSWRRLAVLIRHLPREAATVAIQHGEEAVWGLREQLLALVVDTLRGANWQRAYAGAKSHPPPPQPLPRPGVKTKQIGRVSMSDEEVRKWWRSMSAPETPPGGDDVD